jgi:N-acetyl-alpha-D-muramate 1-phosphate uridylyltransferase
MFPVAVLAGGQAKRLKPLSESIPKALVDINGEPFIAHGLRLLSNHGIEKVVICVGHLGEMIRERIGAGEDFKLQVQYSFDGSKLLGTAGAIKKALPLLGETFFVLYGDSYLDCDYREVQSSFQESGKPALMTVYRNDGRWDTSNVEYEGGAVCVYDKQRPTSSMRHIDYGLGVFGRSAFEKIPDNQPHDLAAVYQHLLARGELAALEVHQRFYEIGSFEGIEELRGHLRSAYAKIP